MTSRCASSPWPDPSFLRAATRRATAGIPRQMRAPPTPGIGPAPLCPFALPRSPHDKKARPRSRLAICLRDGPRARGTTLVGAPAPAHRRAIIRCVRTDAVSPRWDRHSCPPPGDHHDQRMQERLARLVPLSGDAPACLIARARRRRLRGGFGARLPSGSHPPGSLAARRCAYSSPSTSLRLRFAGHYSTRPDRGQSAPGSNTPPLVRVMHDRPALVRRSYGFAFMVMQRSHIGRRTDGRLRCGRTGIPACPARSVAAETTPSPTSTRIRPGEPTGAPSPRPAASLPDLRRGPGYRRRAAEGRRSPACRPRSRRTAAPAGSGPRRCTPRSSSRGR